ncbi:MAG: NYN domain-containing protein [Chloroflexi bacterium]|nr:NYN domain-containing protein [Chloroflexota bacterium]
MTAVFVDGAYLEKVLLYDHDKAPIDFGRLVAAMVEGGELLRAYYYHCLPYQSNPPTNEERARYAARHRFFTALRHIPRFEVRLGKLVRRGMDRDGKPVFQQKRVDLMLGVDMALLAGKHRIGKVALLSGDSDFTPAVEAVKNEGVLTTLWHGSLTREVRPSSELRQACDERRELTAELIQSVLRHSSR